MKIAFTSPVCKNQRLPHRLTSYLCAFIFQWCVACISPIEGFIYLHGHGILLMISAGSISILCTAWYKAGGRKKETCPFLFFVNSTMLRLWSWEICATYVDLHLMVFKWMFKTSLNIDVKGILCELRELPTVKKEREIPSCLSMCCCEDVDCLHVVYLCRCTYNIVLLIIYLSV